MAKIAIFDSSIRDGQHAVRHQFTKNQIKQYARLAEHARIPILVAGHGNGLGASSLHLGQAKTSDVVILRTARKELKKTKLAAFAIPGFATLDNIKMAISEGVQVMQIASHCSEATVTKQYIEYCRNKDIETYGVLMMSHMVDCLELLQQSHLMIGYGATGIFLMDSAGAYFHNDVVEKIDTLTMNKTRSDDYEEHKYFPVGFHSHNNLGQAVSHAITAVKQGATMIDGTARGLGAGAGNCPLEVLVPVLHKMGYSTGINEEALFECAEYIRSQFPPQEITPLSITSGIAGVFSGFKPLVEKASKKYKVSGHKIFKELGRRKVVAGQEDQIIAVAKELKTNPMEALS